MIIVGQKPDCENCLHWRCSRSLDEQKLCALLLTSGVNFSQMPASEDKEEMKN